MTHRHDAFDMPSRTPAPLRPCDVFSEEIHLLVDRELGEAERQVVEDHLAQCSRCTALASHLERMSSVLKAWDVRENEIPAPDLRMQHSVLSRVADSSARRRRDDRFVRVLHMATAAVVVLGIGLAVVLGIANRETPQAVPTFEVSDAPWPLTNRERPALELPTEPFEDTLTADDLLAGMEPEVHPELATDPGFVTDEHMKLFRDQDPESIANLAVRVKRLETFMDRLGVRAMYWNGPYAAGSAPRVVPERTYRWLDEQGILKRWRDNGTQTSPTVVATRGARPSETPSTGIRATGVLAKDMLRPMSGITHPLRPSKQRRLVTVPGMHPFTKNRTKSGKPKSTRGLPTLLELRALTDPVGNIPGLRSGPLGEVNRDFLDPIAAAANGQLRFSESDHAGRVVALVQNTTKPILIPAGQFIVGGYGDRVLRHPVWLPASTKVTPHMLECFVVQGNPHVEAQGKPRLDTTIAGPTLRALLAAGASQADVKAAAKAICKAHHELYGAPFREWSWSLRSFYSATLTNGRGGDGFEAFGRIRWKGTHGFLATDAQGRFLGFELLRITGPSAEALLDRLWRGYAVEAIWRIQSTALRDAFTAPSDGADRVLDLLGEHPASFRIPDGTSDVDSSRTSTLALEASGVELHALEVAGRPALVSGLTAPGAGR